MLWVLWVGGCGGEDEPACIDLDPACAPLYEPTFDNVYTNTLAPSCAPGGSACHSASGNQGGLDMSDIETAYAELTGAADGRARVIPMDTACSEMVTRIHATRASRLMPPGMPLDDAERCAIEQWIARGAER